MNQSSTIKLLSKWLHVESSHIYTVVAIANEYADREGWPVLIVYQDENGKTWACTPEEFLKKKVFYVK